MSESKNRIILLRETPCETFQKNDLPYLFERFYRGDKSHSDEREGFCLGLSIAKVITETHNGLISADYRNGIVTLKVEFPKA